MAPTVAATFVPAPLARRVKVDVLNDPAFMSWLKLAVTAVAVETPDPVGDTEVTLGGTGPPEPYTAW